jgi:4-hydroxybenzoate polyprenyltransferase
MQTLLAWLQLCRLAAVFTAMADIFLGFLLTHDSLDSRWEFGLLLGASSSLYLAGMVFNDVFDREIDAQERPKRPIPSGRVALRGAMVLGTIFVAAGLALAAIAGINSLIVACLLTSAIFLYDGLLKSTIVGPLVMGLCRFLNVMLGASAATAIGTGEPSLAAVWSLPQLHVALGLAVYIVGVTWFARHEAQTSSQAQLAAAIGTVNLGIALLLAFVMNWQPVAAEVQMRAALAMGLIALVVNRRLFTALFDPVPAKVQGAVRTMLLSIIMLDATLVFFAREDGTYAIVVALLLIPATLLGRVLAIT